MIVGFNHNMTYRGVCFHVQTEDSGIRTPHLITLLYHGGTIISSQKTSYADILNVENLEVVVEDLAKEQHKGMLRRLKKGEFDQRIVDLGIKISPPKKSDSAQEEPETEVITPEESPVVESKIEAEPTEPKFEEVSPEPEVVPDIDVAVQSSEETSEPKEQTTDLDDLIFSYLSGDDGKE